VNNFKQAIFEYFQKGFKLSFSLDISHTQRRWFRHIITIGKKRSNASIYALSSQIHQWNIARILSKHLHGEVQTLSIRDVDDLKEIIDASISKTAIQQPDVIADQLLFLAIGAIQIESQNGSTEAWQLLNRAIQNITSPKKDLVAFKLSYLMVTLLTICSYIAINPNIKPHTIEPSISLQMVVVNTPDPVTTSLLELTYNKIKAGTCQLPQAAMLPSEQRLAFLTFVNTGTIDIQHVQDLRQALGYVNCLYPQELMHPTPTYGNTL